jgi:HSP20 family protein
MLAAAMNIPNITKWEPLRDIESIMDRMLSGPSLDISENDGTYVFKVDVPGMGREDLTVSIAGGLITIEGERKTDHEINKPRFHRLERSFGHFSRCFSLPADADPSSVHARCDKGELTIEVAKQSDVNGSQAISVPVE